MHPSSENEQRARVFEIIPVDSQHVCQTIFVRGPFAVDRIDARGKEGRWISERFDVMSFEVPYSGDTVSWMLYPGVYRFAEAERRLLLTVIIDEEGTASFMIGRIPLW